MHEHHPTSSARGFAAGVNFILLRLFSLASLYLLIALFEKNEGVFIKKKKTLDRALSIPGAGRKWKWQGGVHCSFCSHA